MNNIITKVVNMPNIPEPFCMRDWHKVTKDYDALIFDFKAEGDYLPLIWIDDSKVNFDGQTFGLPSYLNSKKLRKNGTQEAINLMSAVLGATLNGIDKSTQEYDYVDMLRAFFNSKNGQNIFLNGTSLESGSSFWYETYPNVLMTCISDYYDKEWLNDCLKIVSDKYIKAIDCLGKEKANFNYTSFDFKSNIPVYNGKWREPEAAAGYAFVLYNAYKKFGEEKYLEYCCYALDFLERSTENVYYEILIPYGAYIAARVNKECGKNYNVTKIVNWCFDGDSACRYGWGVINERWGDIDCHGLCGSTTDWGQRWDLVGQETNYYIKEKSGYAFAANTFSMASGLVAMLKYAPEYAHDIGKWYLNVSNNSRLYYQNAHKKEHQSCSFFKDDENYSIAYEGLRKSWDDMSPYATGDPIRYSWDAIDLGLYGSSHVGMMSGVWGMTSDEKILCVDCNKIDYANDSDEKVYLIYNPYDTSKDVEISIKNSNEVFDYETKKKLCNCDSHGKFKITLEKDSSKLIFLKLK